MQLRKMSALALCILLCVAALCGCARESAMQPSARTLSDYSGWWYMPDEYAADGLPMFEIFELDGDAAQFTIYNAYATPGYTGAAAMQEDGSLVLSLDILGDVFLTPEDTNALYDEDGKLAFVRGDALVAQDAGITGDWYLFGDTALDCYTLGNDNAYSLFGAQENGVIDTGAYTLSSFSTYLEQGEPFEQLRIELGGREARLSPDGIVFFVDDTFESVWYMRKEAIGTPGAQSAQVYAQLVLNSWYSDDAKQSLLFYENNHFAYRLQDADGWFGKTDRSGTWQIRQDSLLLTWDNGEQEQADLFVDPISFFIPSLNQGFALEAGASRRSGDDVLYTLGEKEFSASVRTLNLRAEYVYDISVLANCTDLEELELSYTSVSDLSPLAGLSRLRELQLEGLYLTDISALAGLTSLESLSLRGNFIEDYSVLGGFPHLTSLSVSNTDFANIAPYIHIDTLTSLVASNCSISDLTMLSKSTALKTLMLDNNPLTNEDVPSLSGLTNLERLWLGGSTQIDDVSALAALPRLSYLSFYGRDASHITGLENLSTLTSLELAETKITDISFVKSLTKLEYISLCDEVEDVSALLHLPHLTSVSMSGNAPAPLWADFRKLEEKGVSVSGMPFAYYE